MRLLHLVAPCLMVAAFLAGACSTPRTTSHVAVSLVDVRPQEATTFESRLLVTVRLTNPTTSELAFKGSSHELIINGRAMGGAVGDTPFTVPALSSVTHEATLNLSNIALLGLARELQRQPSATYSLRSTLHTAGPFSRAIRAEHAGVIDLATLADFP